MMRPPSPCETIWLAASWQPSHTPVRFTEITFSHTSKGRLEKGDLVFYARVIDHHVEAAELLDGLLDQGFRTPSGSETSACTEMALPPSFSISWTAFAPSSGWLL